MPFLVCRHIKTNGVQCQSPAMRGQPFCYFHDSFRRRTRGVRSGAAAEVMAPVLARDGNFSVEPERGSFFTVTPIDLGPLEDAESVQVAISAVVNALAGNRMEMKRATALLYGLQLAAMNCRNLPDKRPEANNVMREVAERDGECIAHAGLKSTEYWNHDADDADELASLALQELSRTHMESECYV